ncbi:MAG: VCBS repeat-containing protein [Gemmataceae bacterium]|nr:VCBS repeat-containing protein [Gemmataceae bacterium]
MTTTRRGGWRAVALLLAAVGVAAGGYVALRGRGGPQPDEPPAAPGWFEDVTAGSGVDLVYRNGEEGQHYSILESLGGGVGLIDYDRDGLLDRFLPGGGAFGGPDGKQITGHPCKLYRNLGDFKFADVTAAAGLDAVDGGPWFYTHGCAVADTDNDGWPDLFVTGYRRQALFHNEPDGQGGRRFREVTREAGLVPNGHFWGTSSAFGDLDGDGFADLYVCQYVNWSWENNPRCPGYSEEFDRDVCSPTQFEARPHALYRNNGNGTFTDVGAAAGLHTLRRPDGYDRLGHLPPAARDRLRRADADRDFGKGLGVQIVDVDADGKPDVYVCNDTTDNFLYHNLSKPGDLRLADVGVATGTARDDRGAPNGSMGVDAADYDGTGRPSVIVTNYQNELPALYRNRSARGRPAFVYATGDAGLAVIGRNYVGFGVGFLDIDADGWEDLALVNGHVIRHPRALTARQRPVLFRNPGRPGTAADVKFTDATDLGGPYFRTVHQSRGWRSATWTTTAARTWSSATSTSGSQSCGTWPGRGTTGSGSGWPGRGTGTWSGPG